MPQAKNNNSAQNIPIVKLEGLGLLVDLLNNPKKMIYLKFISGLMIGVGATLGTALALVLLGFAVKYLGGVPWIGDLMHQIGAAAHVQ